MKITPENVVITYAPYTSINGRQAESAAELAVADAARHAAMALQQAGRQPKVFPTSGRMPDICRRLLRLKPRVLVNLCESFNGLPHHEANMAGLWELLDIPFTGNSAAALRLCQDKYRTKLLLRSVGIPTPEGWIANRAADVPRAVRWPLIIKPVAEDGGIGIYRHSVAGNRIELEAAIQRITRRYRQPALVEQFIDGREFNIAIIEHKGLQVLPPAEIVFENWPAATPRIVGFEAKWRPRHQYYRNTVPRCPADIPKRLTNRLGRNALAAWAAAGLRGYARFDFRADSVGKIFLLEINPNPDTVPDSGLGRMLTTAGILEKEFWRAQIETALKCQRN